MASIKNSFLYLGAEIKNPLSFDHNLFEFEETDIWNLNYEIVSMEPENLIPSSRSSKRNEAIDRKLVTGMALPVNVPDWSKILREEFKGRRRYGNDDVGVDEEDRVPPHEYLARNRMASLSVCQGIGRTLKGRDLSSVRNAIWAKTGFQD